MSNKGRIAKNECGKKAIEILAWITEKANAGTPVVLMSDWGGNSLTVMLAKEDESGRILPTTHTHVGNIGDDATLEQLVDSFHSTVTGKGGLSWA